MLPFGEFGVSNGASGFNSHHLLSTLGATLVMSLSWLYEIADAICQKNCGLLTSGANISEGNTLTDLYIGAGGCAVDSARTFLPLSSTE